MIDKTLFVVGWFVVSYVAVQALPVTRLVYAPEAATIADDYVTVYRSFPSDKIGLPRPNISYIETVKPMSQAHNGGQVCVDAGGPFQYVRAESVGRWSIAWAADCTSDPVGYTWAARWTWHIGGLEVGPVALSYAVLK